MTDKDFDDPRWNQYLGGNTSDSEEQEFSSMDLDIANSESDEENWRNDFKKRK